MAISDDKTTREAKLAEALRTNLRKRKAAARGALGGDVDPAVVVAEAAPQPYIAVRKLLGISHRDGDRVELAVEMSAPFPNPDGQGWAVAVRLAGASGAFDTEHGKAAFGRDGLEAARKAIELAQVALDLASTTHDLRWPGDERPYDLSAPV
jgi:hypothetical protein